MNGISNMSGATQFYSNFYTEELQDSTQVQTWNDSSYDSAMFTPSPTTSSISPTHGDDYDFTGDQGRPYLKIIEQPVSRFRFRYRSEMQGAHGSLLGRGETSKKKSYPTVQLQNYDGEAIIRCSLYTASPPHIPHMHQLIGRENNREILDHEIRVSERNNFVAEFRGLGIVHVSKKDLIKELVRKKQMMYMEKLRREDDLYCYSDEDIKKALHQKQPELQSEAEKESKRMDPNKVTLRFEAFVRGAKNQLLPICSEIYSDIIQNMKSAETGELKICRIDRYAGTCHGGDEVFILVEKVCKKNIKVRLFELNEKDEEIWSAEGIFSSDYDVHHQYAIVFRTPPYHNLNIDSSVQVKVELVRPKDGARSEPLSFAYKPARGNNRKRRCVSDSLNSFESSGASIHSGMSSGQDPMLSGSELSSLNSLSFPSDLVKNTLADMGKGSDPDISMFLEFVQSNGFEDYKNSFEEEKTALQFNATNNSASVHSPAMLPYDGLDDLERFLELDKMGIRETSIVVDCAAEKETPLKDMTSPIYTTPQKKDDTLHIAKEAYGKLLKLMKSRNPSRLQDMKDIIRAQDRSMGPLHAAVYHGQLKELSDLLSLIIKINQWKLINTFNHRKETPLMIAVAENRVDCVKLLCMAGANVNLTDHKENTAFHVAAKKKSSKCLQVLLSEKPVKPPKNSTIDLNKRNERGEAAIHIAVQRKDLECVKLLVEAKADVNIQMGTSGQRPLHLAVEFDCIDIISYLLGLPNINVNEVNFNNKTALDLVDPKRDDVLLLFNQEIKAIKDEPTDSDDDALLIDENASEDEDYGDEDGEDENDAEDLSSSEKYSKHNHTATAKDSLAHDASDDQSDSDTAAKDGSEDNPRLMDETTLDIVAQNLDKGSKWKELCEELNCSFLIETITNNARVKSPTRVVINYLEFEHCATLSQFRDAVEKLNAPEAIRAIDKILSPNT